VASYDGRPDRTLVKQLHRRRKRYRPTSLKFTPVLLRIAPLHNYFWLPFTISARLVEFEAPLSCPRSLLAALFRHSDRDPRYRRDPQPRDSGYIFTRLARDKLGIPESHIVEPDEAIRSLVAHPNRAVLFVDDFVWIWTAIHNNLDARIPDWPGATASFHQLAMRRNTAEFYYCPAICTEYGAYQIHTHCPKVLLSAGNLNHG